jgi:hypothetical protein
MQRRQVGSRKILAGKLLKDLSSRRYYDPRIDVPQYVDQEYDGAPEGIPTLKDRVAEWILKVDYLSLLGFEIVQSLTLG